MEPQYRWLVQLLNAYALIDANEQRYAALIGTLNQNIDYLKNVVLARQGGSEEEPSDDGSEDGDGSSDGGSSDVTPVTPEPTPSGGSE